MNQDLRVHYGLPAIARLFSERFDLIHCNIASLALIPLIRRKLNRTPIVETFHGFPQWWVEPLTLDRMAYIAEFEAVRTLAKHTNSKTSVSTFVQSALSHVMGIDSTVIYNGIDRCQLSEPTRKQSRERLDVEDGTTVLLFVGRLHPAKDPMTLLKAFESLVREGRKVKLLVVGRGPLAEPFQRQVRGLNLERLVTIWSYLPSLHPIYSAADIFCFPSINEAFGIVLLEAMDHSLPLLVSDSGAAPEVAGSSGLVFRTGDVVDLSRKLVQLADNPELRQRLGREGPRRLQEIFTVNSMVERYVRVYEETVDSHA